MKKFSFSRIYAVLIKEIIQLKRERATCAMMVLLPMIQILIFGYAINNDPHHLPTAVLSHDHSQIAKQVVTAFENTAYFKITHLPQTEQELQVLMREGKVQFALTIPQDFTHKFIKGKGAQVLLEADASDPTTVAFAVSAASALPFETLQREQNRLKIPLPKTSFQVIIHRLYNPENITSYNIIPGLISVILTMTLVLQTALSVTRETERGTMESLLSMPASAVEIMIGKLSPYVLIGIGQTIIALGFAKILFGLPLAQSAGGWLALCLGVLLFIFGNLALGYLISTVSKSQLQAMQLSVFYMLPSMFLSGFAFPFYGMPAWAQGIGEVIPGTHFLRIIRGALLKNQELGDMQTSIFALLLFATCACTVAVLRSRATLDD